jgi:hypothetical protein
MRTKDSGTVSARAPLSTVSSTTLAASAHRLRTTYTVNLSADAANRLASASTAGGGTGALVQVSL